MPKTSVFRLISLWPPFLVSGIRVQKYNEISRELQVGMSLRFWNWNHEKSHFGGSLYAMTDPFYALLISESLSFKVEVWVKSASIRFLRPGRGRVQSHFHLSDEKLEKIQRDLNEQGKSEPQFQIEVKSSEGKLVAVVEQVVYVKRKKP